MAFSSFLSMAMQGLLRLFKPFRNKKKKAERQWISPNVPYDILLILYGYLDIPEKRKMEKALGCELFGIRKLPKPKIDLFALKRSFLKPRGMHRDFVVIIELPINANRFYIGIINSFNRLWKRRYTRFWKQKGWELNEEWISNIMTLVSPHFRVEEWVLDDMLHGVFALEKSLMYWSYRVYSIHFQHCIREDHFIPGEWGGYGVFPFASYRLSIPSLSLRPISPDS